MKRGALLRWWMSFDERHVKLVVSAEVPLYAIYQGERLKFEFQRRPSRLQEMQSESI
ncbi:AFG1/ZapE family ATPase [Shigella flexneri]